MLVQPALFPSFSHIHEDSTVVQSDPSSPTSSMYNSVLKMVQTKSLGKDCVPVMTGSFSHLQTVHLDKQGNALLWKLSQLRGLVLYQLTGQASEPRDLLTGHFTHLLFLLTLATWLSCDAVAQRSQRLWSVIKLHSALSFTQSIQKNEDELRQQLLRTQSQLTTNYLGEIRGEI